jgi:hypothetical protein
MKTISVRREELINIILWLKKEAEVVQAEQYIPMASDIKTLEEIRHGKQKK